VGFSIKLAPGLALILHRVDLVARSDAVYR
jgi:hypothetical protein